MANVPFYIARPEPYGSVGSTPALPYAHSEVVQNAFNTNNALLYSLKERTKTIINNIRNQVHAPKEKPFSWKDNINYDNGYDSNVEDRFRSEHDYLGLADYLSKFRMDNVVDQREYDREITQLRRYGRQYNALHENASDDETNSISFLEAFNSGNIDTLDDNNPYKKKYSDAISLLGKKGEYLPFDYYSEDYRSDDPYSPDPATISVTFNSKKTNYFLGLDFLAKDNEKENQFEKFAHETGYNAGEIRNILGDNAISVKEGKVVINVPKSNLAGIKFLTEVRNWCNNTGRNTNDVSYASYDTNGKIVTDDTVYIGSRIQDIANLLQQTSNNKEAVMSALGAGEQITSTTILPYMNERQMQLMQLRNAGAIDDTKYSSMLKADNEVYENLLLGTAFSQLDVYTDRGNIEGDETLRHIDDNIERGKLKSYIRNAIRENRVSWRAGISGGKYGTYLVVTPEDEKGELILDEDDARSGATIFIPGLFTKSIQNAFDASTQGRTVAEINSMQQYGYQYTLQNGNILSNVGNDRARLYDKNTDTYKDIPRDEAHNILHQDIIVEEGSRKIYDRMFNLDGSVRNGYNYENDVRKIVVAAANEIYDGPYVDSSDIWYNSREEAIRKNAEGNIAKDYKRAKAQEIYEQIMANIYKSLNYTK